MRFVLTLLAALVFAAPLSAADIKVIGSPGLRQPYTELVPGFEKSTAHKVTTTWGGVNEIADKVAAGEIADIVLLPVKQIDDLIRQGKLDRANTVVIAKSGVDLGMWDHSTAFIQAQNDSSFRQDFRHIYGSEARAK